MTEKRKGYSTPEAQAAANARWAEKNRKHRTYLSTRSSARSFIRNWATMKDLDELEKLIKDKRELLIKEQEMKKRLLDALTTHTCEDGNTYYTFEVYGKEYTVEVEGPSNDQVFEILEKVDPDFYKKAVKDMQDIEDQDEVERIRQEWILESYQNNESAVDKYFFDHYVDKDDLLEDLQEQIEDEE